MQDWWIPEESIEPDRDCELGNTVTNSPADKIKKPQGIQCKNWCVTIHHIKIEQIDVDLDLFKNYVFADEMGKSGETVHVQGAFVLKTKMRLTQLKKVFGKEAHLEKMKGSWDEAFKYCMKENGKKLTNVEILHKLPYEELWDFQKEVVDMVKEPCHWQDRLIHWYWDPEGSQGKSETCKHLIDFRGALVIEGANNDILHGFASQMEKTGRWPQVVVIDIPKINCGGVSYQALEKLKNGFFFSPKYESAMVRFNKPHILVFSNDPPVVENFVANRWSINIMRNKKWVKLKPEDVASILDKEF